MDKSSINQDKLNELLKIAGQKLGKDPAQLQEQFKKGVFDQALKNLQPSQSNYINQLLSNPKMLEGVLNTPKVKEMLNGLMNK